MPKRWTEYSCCHGNVMKIPKHTNRNRDTSEFMDVPDQPSHGHSNKPTFSQITQQLLRSDEKVDRMQMLLWECNENT